jgi:hypothetical protein
VTKHLKISPTLSLPLDFVTSTQAILAKKGKGKTYKASVQAEELLDAQQQIVAIDPTGAWWGLRSSADGKHAGYPITIFGGEHGDVELQPTAGEVIADAIATEHFSAVIDLTLFRKGEALRFMAAFLETLYRKNRAALHLFIDEADVVAPQKTFGPDEARVLGACEDIVRRGRIRGIGCTLITQRPQVLNKNVLSQVDMLTALGMNHPKDIGAIRDWVAVHGDEAQAKQMIADLPALPQGEAWIWAPAADIFKRVTFRDRRTFDSGKTPKAGERKVLPKVLAPVDIQRLGQTIAATVEQQKANDPKALRAKVAELEKQLAAKPAPVTVAAGKTKTVEKPVIKDAQLTRIEKLIAVGEALITRWDDRSADAFTALEQVRAKTDETIKTLGAHLKDLGAAIASTGAPDPVKVVALKRAIASLPPLPAAKRPSTVLQQHQAAAVTIEGLTAPLSALLGAFSWWRAMGHDAPTRPQLAAIVGWKTHGSNLRDRLSELRKLGLIESRRPGTESLTDQGRAAAPGADTRTTLVESIRAALTQPQAKLFDALLANGLATRDELADLVGWERGGSNIRDRLSELNRMEFVHYPERGTVALQAWVTA